MQTKQTITIIGATGYRGCRISKALAKGNNRLLLNAENTTAVHRLISHILRQYPDADIEATTSNFDATWEADIIILAVPDIAETSIAQLIREVATQKIIVSIAHAPLQNIDGLIWKPDSRDTDFLQELLPDSKVVKVYNTPVSKSLLNPAIGEKPADSFVVGTDMDALETVADLLNGAGYKTIIATEVQHR